MLGGSLSLFRIGKTEIRLHATFFLLLAWIAALHWMRDGPQAALAGVAFIALLFACVLLHELGHVMAARRYGIETRDITLLPIGGVASLESMPEKPSQEIFVALAGPAVNFVIAAALYALMALLGERVQPQNIAEIGQSGTGILAQIAFANVALGVFNLIPAFPMDGGRVLRALLAIQLGHVRATEVSATIGQALAGVLVLLGLFGNPLLILIAVFVFLAATSEAGFVQARDATRGKLATHAMISQYAPLGPAASVADGAELLLRTTQHEFPVLDGARRLRGVVTREAIIKALQESGDSTPVLDIMNGDVPTVGENACLDAIFKQMQMEGRRFVGVVDRDGGFQGYLTPENISELIMVRRARAMHDENARGLGGASR